MRLICPNCGAQYEVPDEVIPASGRDVQCSDCSDTWFQPHPDFPTEPETVPDPTFEDWPAPETTAPDPDETSAPHDEAPDPGEVDDRLDDYADTYGAEEEDDLRDSALRDSDPGDGDPRDDGLQDSDRRDDAPDDTPPTGGEAQADPAAPARRELDPSIRDVLREEAEREERARRSEMGAAIETQQDLGLDDHDTGSERRSQEARARMARLRGLPETDPEEARDDIDPGSRRNLLPDIEDINASLGPDRAREDQKRAEKEAAREEPRKKSAFRSGFRLSIVLAVIALLIYVFAPRLAGMVPALSEPLSAYVEVVNSARVALAQTMEKIAGSLGEVE